jgi:hypothetical protein
MNLSKFLCVFNQIDPMPYFVRYKFYREYVINSFIWTLIGKASQNSLKGVCEELVFFLGRTHTVDWEWIDSMLGVVIEASANFKDRKLLLAALVTMNVLVKSGVPEYGFAEWKILDLTKAIVGEQVKNCSGVMFEKLFRGFDDRFLGVCGTDFPKERQIQEFITSPSRISPGMSESGPKDIESSFKREKSNLPSSTKPGKHIQKTHLFSLGINFLSKFPNKPFLNEESILSVSPLLKQESDTFFISHMTEILECFYYSKTAESLLDEIITNPRSTLEARFPSHSKKSHLQF